MSLAGYAAAADVPILDQPQPQQQQQQMLEGEEDPEVGSPFMDFMSKPWMGLWDGRTKIAQKLDVIDWRFADRPGDNNYKEAPEDDYYAKQNNYNYY